MAGKVPPGTDAAVAGQTVRGTRVFVCSYTASNSISNGGNNMRNVIFHEPGHPEQPCHGVRYYALLSVLVALAGLVYLAWSGLHIV